MNQAAVTYHECITRVNDNAEESLQKSTLLGCKVAYDNATANASKMMVSPPPAETLASCLAEASRAVGADYPPGLHDRMVSDCRSKYPN
jgi:hypothetical protein